MVGPYTDPRRGIGTVAGVPDDVVGAAEIAELLGMSRQRVVFLASHDEGFPRPWRTLRMGRLWDLTDVVAWASETGRAVDRKAMRALRASH